jgi:hypothetical protein
MRLAFSCHDGHETIHSSGLGIHAGLAIDLWRHPLDHAVFLSLSGGFDGWPDDYFLPGATLAVGGRY